LSIDDILKKVFGSCTYTIMKRSTDILYGSPLILCLCCIFQSLYIVWNI